MYCPSPDFLVSRSISVAFSVSLSWSLKRRFGALRGLFPIASSDKRICFGRRCRAFGLDVPLMVVGDMLRWLLCSPSLSRGGPRCSRWDFATWFSGFCGVLIGGIVQVFLCPFERVHRSHRRKAGSRLEQLGRPCFFLVWNNPGSLNTILCSFSYVAWAVLILLLMSFSDVSLDSTTLPRYENCSKFSRYWQ